MLRNLLNDESGFLVSAELVLVFTLVFCGVAVGAAMIRDSLAAEMSDVSEAIGALNQSYNYNSLTADASTGSVAHASCGGSGYNDEADDCDCKGISLATVCGKDDPVAGSTPEGT